MNHTHRYITSRKWDDTKTAGFVSDLQRNTPWETMKESDDIDMKTDTWLTYFTNALDEHFPLYKKRIRQNSHPWLDRSTLQLIRRRNQIHRRARKSGEQDLWDLYKQLRNRVTNQLRKSKRDYFKEHLDQNKGKPHKFWKTLKLVLPEKSKSSQTDRWFVDDCTITNPSITSLPA